MADIERAHDFDELLERLQRNDEQYTYSKTWFDSVSTGRKMGRGALSSGGTSLVATTCRPACGRIRCASAPAGGRVPDVFPHGMLNRVTAAAFNEFYYRVTRPRQGAIQNLTAFYHILDVA